MPDSRADVRVRGYGGHGQAQAIESIRLWRKHLLHGLAHLPHRHTGSVPCIHRIQERLPLRPQHLLATAADMGGSHQGETRHHLCPVLQQEQKQAGKEVPQSAGKDTQGQEHQAEGTRCRGVQVHPTRMERA